VFIVILLKIFLKINNLNLSKKMKEPERDIHINQDDESFLSQIKITAGR